MTSEQRRKKHARYRRDIISYGESVIGKLADVSFDAFARDADLRALVIYRLQRVSEATKNMLAFDPTNVYRYPKIPRRDVRDIGNVLRHGYENVDTEVVAETLTSGEMRTLVTFARSEFVKLDG